MDFRQLEAFIATVDQQSFSAAAEVLFLSQPTISSYIHALEQELQTQLIRRTTKKFEVTSDGQQLYGYAKTLLKLQQKAISELSNTRLRDLNIGVSSVPGQCILPQLLALFRSACPEVKFHVTHMDSLDIIRQVESGTLDIGLVGRKTQSKCIFETIAQDELVVAVPNNDDYRELLAGPIDIYRLLKEPFIMRTEHSGTQWETEQLLDRLGVTEHELQIAARVNDAHALQNYVRQGLGIAIVSRRMVEEDAKNGHLLIYPLGDHAKVREFFLVYQDSPYLSKSAISFIQHLKKIARDQAL